MARFFLSIRASFAEIAKALQGLNPAAAEEFVRLYLGDFMQGGEQRKEEE